MATAKKKNPEGGRPTEIDGPVSKVYVTLDEKTVKFMRKLGGGIVSKGIREAARQLNKKGS